MAQEHNLIWDNLSIKQMLLSIHHCLALCPRCLGKFTGLALVGSQGAVLAKKAGSSGCNESLCLGDSFVCCVRASSLKKGKVRRSLFVHSLTSGTCNPLPFRGSLCLAVRGGHFACAQRYSVLYCFTHCMTEPRHKLSSG